jgi:hypothetical protein
MSEKVIIGADDAVDAVVLWVDDNDPAIAEKRDLYLKKEGKSSSFPGALPTFFASNNEIRYCILSILTFAPFIRNIYIVTDGQDPGLNEDIDRYFPGRSETVKIINHSELYSCYEHYLPIFNGASLLALVWKIKGLSENFIFFNDDVILIRDHKLHDWFIDGKPVLRGKWLFPPYKKMLGNFTKILINRNLKGNMCYHPRLSFYLRQWKAAKFMGFKRKYFFHCHTPHPLSCSMMEKIFHENKEAMEKTISCRFRCHEQLLMSSLAYHAEILDGNRQFAKLNLGYFHPFYSEKRINKKIRHCDNNLTIKSVCIQSMDMVDKDVRENIFKWMDRILNIVP